MFFYQQYRHSQPKSLKAEILPDRGLKQLIVSYKLDWRAKKYPGKHTFQRHMTKALMAMTFLNSKTTQTESKSNIK